MRLLLLLLLLSSSGRAEPAAFGLQLFRPSVDSKGYFSVNASQLLGHLDFSIGLQASYARNVLQLSSGARSYRVSDLITAQIQGALGLYRWAEIGFSLPVHILFGGRGPAYQSSASTNYNNDLTFGAQFVGDLGIHGKTRFLNTSKHKVGLALLTSLYVPTGDAGHFLGEGGVTLRPELILDKEWRRFRVALNAGALVRFEKHSFTDGGATLNVPGGPNDPSANGGMPFCYPAADFMSAPGTCGTQQSRTLGTQITYGLGVMGAVVPQKFELGAEVYGYADVTGSSHAFPLEWLAGGKVYLASKSYFQFGAGTGILPGQTGSPDARVFIGFIFEPSIGDRDGDGIKDDIDKCPDEPEDRDDFEDEDGCPDPDNDRDKIPDTDDKCPNEPENYNGFDDEDGCPDKIDLDRDGDRIPDSVDKCPDDPEDQDSFEDEDGCPDPDNDKDKILDIDDLCPNQAEDYDGFEDKDGCPDPDNDKDRIPDVADKCPNQPEIYNGVDDEDGCPDKSIVRKRKGVFEVLKEIHFETASAVIKRDSYGILDLVAATVKGNPQVKLIEIQGHADERGDDDYNLRLTEDRSQAVKQYLLDHGVEPARLQAHGYGEQRAICHQHNEKCWARNRRVEFVILRQEGLIPGVD